MKFKEYLQHKGIDENTLIVSELKKHKKAFSKIKKSENQKSYRKSIFRLEVVFTTEEHETICKEAKRLSLSKSEYLKKSEKAYRESYKLMTEDELKKYRKLIELLLNCSNNVNQIAYHFNRAGSSTSVTEKDFDVLQKIILDMQKQLQSHLLYPKTIKKFFEVNIKHYGEEKFLSQIKKLIKFYKVQ